MHLKSFIGKIEWHRDDFEEWIQRIVPSRCENIHIHCLSKITDSVIRMECSTRTEYLPPFPSRMRKIATNIEVQKHSMHLQRDASIALKHVLSSFSKQLQDKRWKVDVFVRALATEKKQKPKRKIVCRKMGKLQMSCCGITVAPSHPTHIRYSLLDFDTRWY